MQGTTQKACVLFECVTANDSECLIVFEQNSDLYDKEIIGQHVCRKDDNPELCLRIGGFDA